MLKRGLAFYKESGEPWTDEEGLKVMQYVGLYDLKTPQESGILPKKESNKYLFDDGSDGGAFMATWSAWATPALHKCKKVSYESVFKPILRSLYD